MPDNSELDSLVEEFLIESYENLDQLDQDLVTLEEEPSNLERLSRIFRTIHTLKGSCGFLGFTTLEAVAHVGENLLSRLREGELALNAPITTALLSLVDAIRQMLAQIETTGREGDADYSRLIETLTRLQAAPGATADVELEEAGAAESLDLAEPDEESEATLAPAEAAPPQPAHGEQPRPGSAQPPNAPNAAKPRRDARAGRPRDQHPRRCRAAGHADGPGR
jgi:two-component system, chemotaxis family, sensor kinase CheA